MNTRDLLFLARCVHINQQRGQTACAPEKGEGTAASRLEKAGLIYRDPTVKRKPYGYAPTTEGFKVANACVSVIQALAS